MTLNAVSRWVSPLHYQSGRHHCPPHLSWALTPIPSHCSHRSLHTFLTLHWVPQAGAASPLPRVVLSFAFLPLRGFRRRLARRKLTPFLNQVYLKPESDQGVTSPLPSERKNGCIQFSDPLETILWHLASIPKQQE